VRVMIVDDDVAALDRLEAALTCMPDAELVARATTGRQALASAREHRPDVVVLDVRLPAHDGLAVTRALRELTAAPEIIFVSNADQHAARAFELNVVDYLVKPVAFERLREALRRAHDRLRARAADRRFAELHKLIAALKRDRPAPYDHEIWVRNRHGLDRVAVKDVAIFRADGDYVALNTKDHRHLIKEPLGSLAARLDPSMFLRAHRSALVNINSIKGVRRRRPRGLSLTLANGEIVHVGPSFADAVLTALNARRFR
jgi:DNA-binding LytR/AlgR family response regulator